VAFRRGGANDVTDDVQETIGGYTFHCSLHPGMRGTLIVR
jgi:plastocyanin